MTGAGWRSLVLSAVNKSHSGNDKALDLLVRHLVDVDRAKQIFRDIGHYYSSLVETAQEIDKYENPTPDQFEQFKAYLAAPGVDGFDNEFSEAALKTIVRQINYGSIPVVRGFGDNDRVGIVSGAFVEGGTVYIRGTIDPKFIDKAFASLGWVTTDAQISERDGIKTIKDCRPVSITVSKCHADSKATKIERLNNDDNDS